MSRWDLPWYGHAIVGCTCAWVVFIETELKHGEKGEEKPGYSVGFKVRGGSLLLGPKGFWFEIEWI